MIKVVLVDDHQIVRDGIRLLIDNMADIEVVAEMGNARELITMLKSIDPDLAIIDISMPDMSGIELTGYLNQHHPRLKVLILSMYTSEEFIFNSIKAGASGYLPKNTTRQELEAAIKEIMAGGEYFGESISNVILKSYVKKAQEEDEPEEKGLKMLSGREREVLELFCDGKTNKEIADELFISTRTVESHKGHIMHKLELKTTVDLVKFAIKSGILEI
jgi:DNA-binding NarL/FixJ family response regulator